MHRLFYSTREGQPHKYYGQAVMRRQSNRAKHCTEAAGGEIIFGGGIVIFIHKQGENKI